LNVTFSKTIVDKLFENKKENDKKIEDICKIARRNPATCGPPCCNHSAKKRLDFRRCKNTYKKCMADHSKMLTECVLERTKCYAIVRTADVTKETVDVLNGIKGKYE